MKKHISLFAVLFLFAGLAGAQEKKVTPIFEIGAGASLETRNGYGETVGGLATELSLGLDVLFSEKWSVMPSVGHNAMIGGGFGAFVRRVGADADFHDFINAACLFRYHDARGMTIGFGPAVHVKYHEDTYYIDADPSDHRNGKEKLKPFDIALRTSITEDVGKHWLFGVRADLGLRNMLMQYPDLGISGHDHLLSLYLVAGLRF